MVVKRYKILYVIFALCIVSCKLENLVVYTNVRLADNVTSIDIELEKYLDTKIYIIMLVSRQIESVFRYHFGNVNCENFSKLESELLELRDMNIVISKYTDTMRFQIDTIKIYSDGCKSQTQVTNLLFVSSNWSKTVSLDSAIYEMKFQFYTTNNDSLTHENFGKCFSESFQYVESKPVSIKPLSTCE
jgi:hypothetical protein